MGVLGALAAGSIGRKRGQKARKKVTNALQVCTPPFYHRPHVFPLPKLKRARYTCASARFYAYCPSSPFRHSFRHSFHPAFLLFLPFTSFSPESSTAPLPLLRPPSFSFNSFSRCGMYNQPSFPFLPFFSFLSMSIRLPSIPHR